MIIRPSNQFKGFTLLELVLVLLIAASIIFLGVERYQTYQRNKDIQALQQNINLIFQALNNYYHSNCKASQTFTVNISNLPVNVLANLNKTNLASPSSYQVSATLIGSTQQTQKPIYKLSVSATLNVPSSTIDLYQRMLNASSSSGTTLTWVKLPSYTIPTTSSGLWIMNTGLRAFKENTTSAQGDDTCGY